MGIPSSDQAKPAAIPRMIGLVTTPRTALRASSPADARSPPPSAVSVSTTTANTLYRGTLPRIISAAMLDGALP